MLSQFRSNTSYKLVKNKYILAILVILQNLDAKKRKGGLPDSKKVKLRGSVSKKFNIEFIKCFQVTWKL